jgi:sporulation protein YlmC with PRC-barrel domain
MNRTILVIASLSLASGLAVAQEQEDQEFNPNRDIVSEPKPEPQTSMDEQQQDTPVQGDYGSEPTQGAATQSTDPASSTMSEGTTDEGLSNMTAEELEGKKVVTMSGEEIGEIGEVGKSPAHTGRIATVEVGGFLGIGEKTIAIPLSELDKSVSDEDSVRTSMTRSSIESQPEFDESGFTPDDE